MLNGNLKAVYAAVKSDDSNQSHPLCCLLDAEVSLGVKDYLESGGAKVSEWLNDIGAKPVLFDNPFQFLNLNKPSDWVGLKGGL